MKFEIRHRYSGAVLFARKTKSLKLCVEAAVISRANLTDANLTDACLAGANLPGACLAGANLTDANLTDANLTDACLAGANLTGAWLTCADGGTITAVSERPLLTLGPLGSRHDHLRAWLTDAGVYIRTGCFWDTLPKFKSAVKKTHGTTTVHAKEYALAIKLIEAHARMWKPKKEKAK